MILFMAVKKGNIRLTITLDESTMNMLLFLCKFFGLSKTNTINKLISLMYEKNGYFDIKIVPPIE